MYNNYIMSDIIKSPKQFTINKDTLINSEIKLIIKGQTVFVFENENNGSSCVFSFLNKEKTDGLKIEFTPTNVKVNRMSILDPLIDTDNNKGLIDSQGAYYWFSLDGQNQTLYAGIGETRLETAIYKYKFVFEKERDDLRKMNKLFLESLVTLQLEKKTSINPLRILRDPITLTIPLLVKSTDALTMNDIATGDFLAKANLSTVGQKLYDCVSGKNFVLDDKDFPDFSKAIEYSIATEGKWCNQKLKEKSTEFNKENPNIKETYLRITLSQNNGESPGIPYVLEIWPVGHFSPVHNHAGSNAIIRVLYGSINVKLFPFLSGETAKIIPFGVKDFNKDDVTWISSTLNQTHQLLNLETNKKTCITIQCYMYDEENNGHYDYFDFVDDKGLIQQYEPDSDMDFVAFKELMKKDWDEYKRTHVCYKLWCGCF